MKPIITLWTVVIVLLFVLISCAQPVQQNAIPNVRTPIPSSIQTEYIGLNLYRMIDTENNNLCYYVYDGGIYCEDLR